MNTSFSKRRHLSEANERLENRFLQSKKIISEAPEVMPSFNASEIIALTQDILKQNGAPFNIEEYVSMGDNPMCIPDNDKTGILSKVFDFFDSLGTTNELESAIGDVIQGQSIGGLQIPDELKNDAAIIGAGILASDEAEAGPEEMSEQQWPKRPKKGGINYKKRHRQQNSKRSIRKHTKCYRKHKFK
jgi:hypothetical protein